jgi:hypothetical protein
MLLTEEAKRCGSALIFYFRVPWRALIFIHGGVETHMRWRTTVGPLGKLFAPLTKLLLVTTEECFTAGSCRSVCSHRRCYFHLRVSFFA